MQFQTGGQQPLTKGLCQRADKNAYGRKITHFGMHNGLKLFITILHNHVFLGRFGVVVTTHVSYAVEYAFSSAKSFAHLPPHWTVSAVKKSAGHNK